ncbi:MAG: LytTR family DNA-binding domain-containing protein [Bacteroidales bacterium]|nr:LytTR family DNA-binding domain-containing protein [Bacteroidales bacterium]MCF8405783.1 LytTR family DNA-binding domain-containing protein [Bacteroidales bacterium]
MRVLIVEDETYAQLELKRLLTEIDHDFEVMDCLDSVESVVHWFNSKPLPDLIFLDIQLSDGLSFEIFNQVTINTPVIFTTAFDEYALQAFKVNSIDYLLKPIKQEELEAAIVKYQSVVADKPQANKSLSKIQIEELLNIYKPTFKSRFLVKSGDQINYVEAKEVAYFIAEDNEVLLVSNKNKRYVVDYTVSQLEGMLDPHLFYRATRSLLVSLGAIKKISKYFNSRLHLELNPPTDEQVLVSRVKVSEFLEWIDK